MVNFPLAGHKYSIIYFCKYYMIIIICRVYKVRSFGNVKVNVLCICSSIQSIYSVLPYNGLFSRVKIFANFTNCKQFMKILTSKCSLFNEGSDTSLNLVQDFEIPKFLARFRISRFKDILFIFVVLSLK